MIALYPGSFDPATYGHIDVINRTSKLFDKLIIGVLDNSAKQPLFTADERVSLLKEVTNHLNNIEVYSFKGLTIEFAKKLNAKILVRGLRAVTDFEYEFQIALANRSLDNEIETFFITTDIKNLFMSSNVVKEIALHGGNIDMFVPPEIKKHLSKKYGGVS